MSRLTMSRDGEPRMTVRVEHRVDRSFALLALAWHLHGKATAPPPGHRFGEPHFAPDDALSSAPTGLRSIRHVVARVLWLYGEDAFTHGCEGTYEWYDESEQDETHEWALEQAERIMDRHWNHPPTR